MLENNTYPVPNKSVIGSIILGANVDKLNNSKGGKAVLVLEKLQVLSVKTSGHGTGEARGGVKLPIDTLLRPLELSL